MRLVGTREVNRRLEAVVALPRSSCDFFLAEGGEHEVEVADRRRRPPQWPR